MTLTIELYFMFTYDTIFLLDDVTNVTMLVNNNYKSSLQVFCTLHISTNHFHIIYSSEWLTVRSYLLSDDKICTNENLKNVYIFRIGNTCTRTVYNI